MPSTQLHSEPETERAIKRQRLHDRNVVAIKPLVPPACVLEELPVTPEVHELVDATREAVSRILHGEDDRLVAIVGPCSIHDVDAAMDYAKRLKTLADELNGELLVIMRTYFEKPRTTVGWKGLINDPDLNQSFNINKGIRIARKLLLDVNALGLPVSLEFLDTISPQFTSDLISWGAIGARTTESQLHRELTSGLSMPVGFKNGTGGDAKVAVDAAVASSQPHNFLGLNEHGLASIVRTKGNKDCHVILRGGSSGPNYEKKYIDEAAVMLVKAKQPSKIMVDCSHGNSRKLHANQPKVASYLAGILAEGESNLLGVMIESNIVEGNQSLGDDPSKLIYGKSITDACINWDDTVTTLKELASAVTKRRKTVATNPVAN
ncbi:Phospho-2-dehydro-3-deoxyheptonate aldolase [Phytophthora citrophthora]|uniref:3-deoxy-7-phosphoheptulonate synthase n=1 Tax=Phytophthora citrophthora TaxID=4793 RepID=A0AAD9GMX8_9STRA|nr:Phospho-2-dehydro-3-deoxyheptonate aldolase [Phytophthora citrophthora]